MRNQLRSLYLTLLATFSVLCGGCNFYGDKQRSWTEQVALEDGTPVQIRRHVKFTDSNSWSGDTYGAVETEATLEILTAEPTVPKWSAPLIPLVLYRDAGEWVLVTKSADCIVWSNRGSPRPPYWEFRLRDGNWVETVLSQGSIGRRTNLFFHYRKQVPQHVSVADKIRIQSDPTLHELYLSINPDPKIFNCQ